MFAPKYLENKLKFSPYVKEAVCMGQGRPYVTVLVNIDLAAVGNWAERRGIAYTSYTDLSQKPEVYDLIQGEVDRVNRSLLDDDVLRGAQIRKFLILHKELDPDDEEITRTRKVRRGYIAQKYAALIEALYGDRDRVSVEARVTYEDGRTGTVRADVTIRELTHTVTGNRRARALAAKCEDISVRFGALLALNRGQPQRPPRRDRRHHRAQRRRQDDAAQLHQRLLPALRGPHRSSRAATARACRRPTWPRSASRAPSRTSPCSGA